MTRRKMPLPLALILIYFVALQCAQAAVLLFVLTRSPGTSPAVQKLMAGIQWHDYVGSLVQLVLALVTVYLLVNRKKFAPAFFLFWVLFSLLATVVDYTFDPNAFARLTLGTGALTLMAWILDFCIWRYLTHLKTQGYFSSVNP